MYQVKLRWHKYRYLPYEKQFAIREIKALPGVQEIYIENDYVSIVLDQSLSKELSGLVYFSHYEVKSGLFEKTLQSILESDNSSKRQATRYGVHGLHEYKGKFNPQIVRGLLNAYAVGPKDTVLDPFCGSGTTLIEAMTAGCHAIGWDLNPFAVYLANTKAQALHTNPDILEDMGGKIIDIFTSGLVTLYDTNTERYNYLEKWFTKDILHQIETLRIIIQEHAKEHEMFFKIVVSDLLRDYSLQEPADLRTRRRKSELPELPFMVQFERDLNKKINTMRTSYEVYKTIETKANACVRDGRLKQEVINGRRYDFVLTSPPYVTALPYIDTQRLSLVWLGLLDATAMRKREEQIIGSREASKKELSALKESLVKNTNGLDPEVWEYCVMLCNSVNHTDGFRRQAVPGLLYRYLTDMSKTFSVIKDVLKRDGMYALVVGNNQSTLGGNKISIDTPTLLAKQAEYVGWKILDMMPLETYKRYGMHAANAVKGETLVVLKNE